MSKMSLQLRIIEKVALALGELNKQVAFVGGSIISFYANDPAAEEPRPTQDIDITLQIATLGQLEALREELQIKGFSQHAEDNVICRFRLDDILVDVMSTQPVGWAPANRWFEPGFRHLNKELIGETEIQILSLPYFLASKFDAFHDRGSHDPRTSKDFEDIVYLLDNVIDLPDQIKYADASVKQFLKAEFDDMLKKATYKEAILANLPYMIQESRFQIVSGRIGKIAVV
jgi:predicted nucleotidyltransferase